jgi:hypothetical protein
VCGIDSPVHSTLLPLVYPNDFFLFSLLKSQHRHPSLPHIFVPPGYKSCEHNLLTGQHNHARFDADMEVRLTGVSIGSDVCRFEVRVYCTFVLHSTCAGTFKLLHIRLGNTDSMPLVGRHGICISREPTPPPQKSFRVVL